MPKTLRFSLVFVMLISLCWVGYSKYIRPKPSPVAGLIPVIEKEDDDDENEEEEEDGIKEAQEMEFEMTKDLTLGYVPKFRLVQAGEQLVQQRRAAAAAGRLQGLSAFTWAERGPYADAVGPSNGNGRITNDQVTSGRMRAIWTDLADATNKTIWIGGIDGGIWKTTDVTADPSPWTLVTDATANIAIASICQSPVNTNIMYFGTGEKH